MVLCLTLALLPVSGCSTDTIVSPASGGDGDGVVIEELAAVVAATAVGDLEVTAASDSTVTLAWTEVDDGRGRPANYRLKYAQGSISWGTATVGCDRTMHGVRIGASMSCTVVGLTEGTAYEFQLMSFRLQSGKWQGAVYSNVASGSTTTPAPPDASAVTDLEVVSASETSVTVRWTEVDDGTGLPARYRVKYAEPPIAYGSALVACDEDGTAIGATASCTIPGLTAGTAYEFQLMSYRVADGKWEGAVYSNTVTAQTTATVSSGPNPIGPSGIWVDVADVMRRPTSGPEWERLLRDAQRDPGSADIANQDSDHDVYTLAAALVCVRTGQYCDKARRGVVDAIGTEAGGRWLAVGRNLGAYVIAADLLDLRAGGSGGSDGQRVEEWMRSWLTKRLRDNNKSEMRPFGPFHASANAAAQEGFAFTAVAAYLGDAGALERAWDAFRTFVCDPAAPDREHIYLAPPVKDGWTHDDARPCAVNPMGTSKRVPSGMPGAGSVRRIDGALVGDMRRGGTYRWMPGYTQYPWVGLEGLVPAAVILERAGYPAFDVADRAVLRTLDYLWYLRTSTGDTRWFDGSRSRDIVHLVNFAYGSSFPVVQTVAGGRTVGYTSWTHPGL